MSESTFPFAPPDQAPPAAEDAGSTGRSRVVALGALAAVALGAGAFLFLGAGGGEEEDVALPARRAPGVAAAPSAAKPPVLTLPAVSTVVLGRNPFKALYVEPEAAPAQAPLTATAQNALPPLQVATAGGGAHAGPSGAQPAAPAKPVLHKLVLTRVYGTGKDRTAVFSIDGKQQIAKVGATFGPSAELLLLSLQQGPANDQWTAVLQVGDGDPFDVVTNDPAYVP